MHVIEAFSVNDAYVKGVSLLMENGMTEETRAGTVLVSSRPVTTVYNNPTARVLFNKQRDANPYFHLMESLWMLAGQNDARWLDTFVADFSKRFAEDDGHQHGAYGFRWRQHFDMEGAGARFLPDQLETIIGLLIDNPQDRRVVLTMWDPVADLGARKRDIPCNTQAYLRIRGERGQINRGNGDVQDYDTRVLDLTVCCRSNDIIWGAYGANAVHFSMLQEYLAARVGVGVGRYYQISNNFHAYHSELFKRWPIVTEDDPYLDESTTTLPLVEAPHAFDADVQRFVSEGDTGYRNPFFNLVAFPMLESMRAWRAGSAGAAYAALAQMPSKNDWRRAAEGWLERRLERRKKKA